MTAHDLLDDSHFVSGFNSRIVTGSHLVARRIVTAEAEPTKEVI
jgi:hypothetical protein